MPVALIIALAALLMAGVGQAQNRSLRHRVAALTTTHQQITRQQRAQAEHDIDTLVRVLADRDTTPDLLDVDGEDVVRAAEDIARESGGVA